MPIARSTARRIFSSLLAHNTSMAPRSDRGSPFSSGEGRPKGKSVDQPHAKQIAPAEGVTPPAEVHACPTVHSAPCTIRYRCLPTGVTGSRSPPTPPGSGQIVLCRPDAWVRVSFAHTRVSIVGWIYDPDHSLASGRLPAAGSPSRAGLARPHVGAVCTAGACGATTGKAPLRLGR